MLFGKRELPKTRRIVTGVEILKSAFTSHPQLIWFSDEETLWADLLFTMVFS